MVVKGRGARVSKSCRIERVEPAHRVWLPVVRSARLDRRPRRQSLDVHGHVRLNRQRADSARDDGMLGCTLRFELCRRAVGGERNGNQVDDAARPTPEIWDSLFCALQPRSTSEQKNKISTAQRDAQSWSTNKKCWSDFRILLTVRHLDLTQGHLHLRVTRQDKIGL